jgi:cell division protein FtsI (penicillin-binding protein 3)
MRKMMEGVVLFGTGKQAQLNGYSSGGKTGTAQKIDPVTHTYSKTMHIASFAGIAPVNNPVISVAVVIDNPKGGSYYGAAVSAPVFAEVAQQVLEYLGVPHDIDVRAAHAPSKSSAPIVEDDAHAQSEDINALYDAANDLPSDDPLRAGASQAGSAGSTAAQPASSAAKGKGAVAKAVSAPPQISAPAARPPGSVPGQQTTKSVMIDESHKLRVPSLVGLPVRKVIEQAGAVGLQVQISGSGTVREQAPAAGTMVAPGTRIVVRCGHP